MKRSLILLGISIQFYLIFGQQCQNHEKKFGTCLPIDSCKPLRIILEKPVIPHDEYNFVIKSKCPGTNLVCCINTSNTPRIDDKTTLNPIRSNLPIPGSSDCGVHTSDKIIGGKAVAIDEYPWMILLEYIDVGKTIFGCGGALINNRYVLTAAHCIRTTPKLRSVRLGEWNTTSQEDCSATGICSDPVQDIPIEQTIIHNGYHPADINSHHDIALIRLSRPVQYSYFIKPICLPTDAQLQNDAVDVGKKFTVAGWGRTENGRWSDVKLKVDVGGVDLQRCSQVYGNKYTPQLQRQLTQTQICAGGEENKDSCGGDSGGPLMKEFKDSKGNSYVYLAGIVSYGPTECGMKGWPGVYTRVTSYLDWIQNNIKP